MRVTVDITSGAGSEVHVVGVRLTTKAGAERLCKAITEAAAMVWPEDTSKPSKEKSRLTRGAGNDKK